MSPADGILAILVDAGIVSTGWVGRVGALHTQANQDQSIAVLDNGGRGAEVKVAIDYPTVQVLIRGSKAAGGYSAGYAKAEAVLAALQGIDQNPSAYPNLVSCVVRGGITGIGRDENDRPLFSLNFNLITNPSDAGFRTY